LPELCEVTLGRASRRSDGPQKKLKAEQSPQVSMLEASQICFDCNACFNCDPHWLFLVPTLSMYQSLMYFVHISRILRILPQFRKLQAAVLEFLYSFFEWHDISAGNHAFFFITCNELTLSMDFCVQVDGSMEKCRIILRPSLSS
jgi:hypothetical protein